MFRAWEQFKAFKRLREAAVGTRWAPTRKMVEGTT